jgi:Zn-finger nucleic acid-binding protein
MSSPQCPKCSQALDEALLCPGCGGQWIDLEAHRRDLGDAEGLFATLGDRPADAALRCPRCAAASLREIEFADCHLDVCAACHGIYFDAGELDRVRKRLAAGPGRSLLEHGTEVVKLAGEFVVDELVCRGVLWLVETAVDLSE